MTRPDSEGSEAAVSGLRQIEGYLMAHTYRRTARAEAEAFADLLPWLTEAQYEEVVRIYTADRLDLTRRMLKTIRRRGTELQREYADRYEKLRRGLLCKVTALLLVATSVSVLNLVLVLDR
ncbi:hypothetical protein [Streptomyces sp. WMMB 322]|uniref:hypothetical protein n=1 Tax=Streptomyces sp. WMMB 322 TaxID=1286821 RepID=UPI0006E2DF29|nr:hypothetical protein [Streptomyces sp. WMMB 322]SCK30652.1 hypothetical protein H180DRAFT_02403 [Streptomyces sp. WMMB 322]